MPRHILVHERVHERHPGVTEEDVRGAWAHALSARTRSYGPPDVIAAAGLDTKGRMIEMLGIEMADGSVLVYHAMRLTTKMARALGL